jgi:hypothetical protein
MAMDDRGARLGGINGGIGDLLGRARHMRAAVLGGAGSGDGAGDENLAVHGQGHTGKFSSFDGRAMMDSLQRVRNPIYEENMTQSKVPTTISEAHAADHASIS